VRGLLDCAGRRRPSGGISVAVAGSRQQPHPCALPTVCQTELGVCRTGPQAPRHVKMMKYSIRRAELLGGVGDLAHDGSGTRSQWRASVPVLAFAPPTLRKLRAFCWSWVIAGRADRRRSRLVRRGAWTSAARRRVADGEAARYAGRHQGAGPDGQREIYYAYCAGARPASSRSGRCAHPARTHRIVRATSGSSSAIKRRPVCGSRSC